MSENRGKYESLAGNKNALKYPTPVDSSYTFRCHSQDREQWENAAAQVNMHLSEWVVRTLNQAAKK